MALPYSLQVEDFRVQVYRNAESCVAAGTGLDLSPFGFVPGNQYPFGLNFAQRAIPTADGALPLYDGTVAPREIILVSPFFWKDEANDLWGEVEAITAVMLAQDPTKHHYLRLGYWDGAAVQWYRVYGVLKGIEPTIIAKTHQTAVSFTMRFAVTDPFLYGDTVQTETDTASGGNASVVFTVTGSLETKRITVDLTYDGATITNPTITHSTFGSAVITDSLAIAGLMHADTYMGRYRKGPSVLVGVDDIAAYDGIWLTAVSSVQAISAAATGTTYGFNVNLLPRMVVT